MQFIKLGACRQGNVPKPAERKFAKRYAQCLKTTIQIGKDIKIFFTRTDDFLLFDSCIWTTKQN